MISGLRFPLRSLSLATCSLVFAVSASALIAPKDVASTESEAALQKTLRHAGYTTPFPYWRYVGQIERSTGVYLGNGYVLTAAHVGAGTFRTSNGTLHPLVAGSARIFRNRDGSTADLCLFQIQVKAGDPLEKLPAMPLSTLPPRRGRELLMVAGGAGWKPGQTGFAWGDDYRVRWGLNAIEEIYSVPMPTQKFFSYGFATRFDPVGNQCQAAPGDSGGAAFHYNTRERRWELAGVIVAVDSAFGSAAFGNQTYIADPVLFRRDLAAALSNRQSMLAVRP
jgi:hypothetical protein